MHFGLNRSIDGCDNGEKRRKFEEWKNARSVTNHGFKESIRRIVTLFLDSLRLTEKKYRMESLERESTRKYDALKKHKGLKGRRLIGKTLGFEKLVSNERRIGRKEIRRRTKDG